MAYLFKQRLIYEKQSQRLSVKGKQPLSVLRRNEHAEKTQGSETTPLGNIFAADPIGNLKNPSVWAFPEDFNAFIQNGFVEFQSLKNSIFFR